MAPVGGASLMTAADHPITSWLMAANEPDPWQYVAALSRRPLWQADAACRGIGPAVFFPGKGQSHATARALCATCPVADECRAYATANSEILGVWGGTSTQERMLLRNAADPRP